MEYGGAAVHTEIGWEKRKEDVNGNPEVVT